MQIIRLPYTYLLLLCCHIEKSLHHGLNLTCLAAKVNTSKYYKSRHNLTGMLWLSLCMSRLALPGKSLSSNVTAGGAKLGWSSLSQQQVIVLVSKVGWGCWKMWIYAQTICQITYLSKTLSGMCFTHNPVNSRSFRSLQLLGGPFMWSTKWCRKAICLMSAPSVINCHIEPFLNSTLL